MIQTDNKPIYVRLADQICDRILTGQYQAQGRIPSVREYAVDQQVNPATAMRAFEIMERQGIIFNKRGLGYYVADAAPDIIRRQRLELILGEESELFFSRLSLLNVTPDQLRDMYSDYINKHK